MAIQERVTTKHWYSYIHITCDPFQFDWLQKSDRVSSDANKTVFSAIKMGSYLGSFIKDTYFISIIILHASNFTKNFTRFFRKRLKTQRRKRMETYNLTRISFSNILFNFNNSETLKENRELIFLF